MTQAQARAELAKLGMTLRKTECGEYRVNAKGGAEATAYYTDCLDDAVGTARLEAERATSRRFYDALDTYQGAAGSREVAR